MARYAEIHDGIIINVIESDKGSDTLVLCPDGNIGDRYIDGSVVPSQTEKVMEVTMRQAELALYSAGLLDEIESLIASSTREDQINWKRATVIYRNNPLISTVQSLNNLSDLQVDELFFAASKL